MSESGEVPSTGHPCAGPGPGSALPRRRGTRLNGHDYAQPGAYFVTICTRENECLFGDVVDDTVRLNDYGRIAHEEWLRTASIRPRVTLDTFAIMPNHVHGIIVLADDTLSDSGTQRAPTGEQFGRPTPDSIPTIVRGFKACVTYRINTSRTTPGLPVWQRGFYEHIVRDAAAAAMVREYITNNPLQWALEHKNHTQ